MSTSVFYASIVVSVLSILSTGCGSSTKTERVAPAGLTLVRSDFKEGEIRRICETEIQRAEASLRQIENLPPEQRTLDNTLLAFEGALTELFLKTDAGVFMGSVSTNEKHNPEATECEEKRGQFLVQVSSRKKIYDAFASLTPRTSDEARLHQKTKEGFERAGIQLPEPQLKKLTEIKKEITKLETQYSNNLNQDNSTVEFSAEELKGVTEDFLARLKKNDKGLYVVTTKSTDYVAVMENAVNAKTRERMMTAYLTRGGMKNVELLQTTIKLRQQAAEILGYKNWTDFKTADRTAKDKKTVDAFLSNLRSKLKKRYDADTAQLLKFKKTLDPKAQSLDPWDIAYLSYQLKKRDYALDEEQVRQYFPADRVVEGVFQVYSTLLGLKFEKVPDAVVWAEGVALYAVKDAKTQELLGYFYTDFFPRKGKYGHAAAFTLISGRRKASGEYQTPVSAIVSNFTPPANDKPSLLTHDEVETFFHEFGHIMHQVLTRAPYSSLAGTSVPWDFVEAPSQVLENWAWDSKVLKQISGHYQDSNKKLPDDLIAKMLKARRFQEGTMYSRQLLYAIYDVSLHSADPKADALGNFRRLYQEILGITPHKDHLFPASFGHLMGGYDAGYYGYLWSKVFAEDMFSEFEKKGIMSQELGLRYRREILEVGNMRDAMDSLENFLGRKASSNAFFKSLGIR